MAKEVRAAIYARVSTEHKGQNPETQLIELRDYCQRRQWEYAEYVDVGTSGSTTDRPALNRLVKDIHWHRVNTVVIWKIDRLCRNTRELLNLADDWKQRHVNLIVTTTDIDTTSPGGYLFFVTLGLVAEFERNTLIERVNAGLDRARREGKRLGRPKRRVRIPPRTVEAIRRGELSLYSAAKQTGIPRSTLKRRLASASVTTIVGTKLVSTSRTAEALTRSCDQNG